MRCGGKNMRGGGGGNSPIASEGEGEGSRIGAPRPPALSQPITDQPASVGRPIVSLRASVAFLGGRRWRWWLWRDGREAEIERNSRNGMMALYALLVTKQKREIAMNGELYVYAAVLQK